MTAGNGDHDETAGWHRYRAAGRGKDLIDLNELDLLADLGDA